MIISSRALQLLLILCATTLFTACSSNINVPDKSPSVGATFSMIIAADSQYPWWNAHPCNNCSPADCTAGLCDAEICNSSGDKQREAITECEKRMGGPTIRDQIAAGSKLTTLTWPADMGGAKLTAPVGLVVNGDLTAYFHQWQVDQEDRLVGEELEKVRKSDPNNPILKIVPFLGLGNHDYRNNVCDCRSYSPHDYNICARMAAHMMYKLYSGKKDWIRWNACSLAYSWTFNRIRFVQMNLWPGYKADFQYWLTDPKACLAASHRFNPDSRSPDKCNDTVVYPSWDFLEENLKTADQNSEKTVLLFHDPGEYWSAEDVKKFKELVAKHDVLAVFAGHDHGVWGVRTDYSIAQGLVNKGNKNVPLILSGASEGRLFVYAEFSANSMKAGVVSAKDGTPSFQAATTGSPTPRTEVKW